MSSNALKFRKCICLLPPWMFTEKINFKKVREANTWNYLEKVYHNFLGGGK